MKKIIISAAPAYGQRPPFAQNLNPVVEVTNTYAREADGIEKPAQLLPVPDSVYSFNLDMDYSVRNTPYQGSYEFKPYLVQLRPGARLSGEQKLYLKAGAGYSLHPELDLVWDPGGRCFNIYAARGLTGLFQNISRRGGLGTGGEGGGGRGAPPRAGLASGRLQGRGTVGRCAAPQRGPDRLFPGRRPLPLSPPKGGPGPGPPPTPPPPSWGLNTPAPSFPPKELHTVTDLSLGLRAGSRNAFRVDAGAESVSFGAGYALKFEAAPHYLLTGERFNMNLGAKLRSFSVPLGCACIPSRRGFVFPDVHISFRIADAAVLQAAATGGDRLNSYDSLLERNPYLGSFLWHRDVTVERFNIMAGLRGSAAGRFSLTDLRARICGLGPAGFQRPANRPLAHRGPSLLKPTVSPFPRTRKCLFGGRWAGPWATKKEKTQTPFGMEPCFIVEFSLYLYDLASWCICTFSVG